jgi:hypothetical protein
MYPASPSFLHHVGLEHHLVCPVGQLVGKPGMLTLLCGTLFRRIEWVSYPGMYLAWQFVLHHVLFDQHKLHLLGLLAAKYFHPASHPTIPLYIMEMLSKVCIMSQSHFRIMFGRTNTEHNLVGSSWSHGCSVHSLSKETCRRTYLSGLLWQVHHQICFIGVLGV